MEQNRGWEYQLLQAYGGRNENLGSDKAGGGGGNLKKEPELKENIDLC